jgi:hypothetical protein
MSFRTLFARRPSAAAVISLVALVFAMGGFAVASIPGRGGSISACYRKTGGAVRVIDTAKRGSAGRCSRSEKALSWNQQGIQGIAGSPGQNGVNGANGAPATKLWAVVETTSTAATLVRGSGVTSVSRAGQGQYNVTFNQSILNCAYVATLGATTDGVAPNGEAAVEQQNATLLPNTLNIRVQDSSGTEVDLTAGRGFHLAVFC